MINQCTFIGNVVRNPDVRTTESGHKYALFTIACNEPYYKKQDGTEVPERVEYVNIQAWRGLAETIEKHVDKGQQLFIQGKFRTRKYKAEDGTDRWTTEIVAETMKFLGSKREQAPAPVEPERAAQVPSEPSPFPTGRADDDLLF